MNQFLLHLKNAVKDYTDGLKLAPYYRSFLVNRVRVYDKLGMSKLAKIDKARINSIDKDIVPFSFQPDWTGRRKRD